MKSIVLKKITSFIVVFLLLILFVTNLEGASPSFQPTLIRNQSLMFEDDSSGIKEIKLIGNENQFLDYFKFHINKSAQIGTRLLVLRDLPKI